MLLLLACRPTPIVTDVPTPIIDGTLSTHTVPFEVEWDNSAELAVGPVFSFELPDDVVSFSATVQMRGRESAFARVEFSGVPWIEPDTWDTAPYFHWAVPSATVTAPLNAQTALNPGTLLLQPASLTAEDGTPGTLHLFIRHGTTDTPTVDLNIGLVGGTSLDPAQLDAAIDVMKGIWAGGGGPIPGQVGFFPVSGDTFLDYDDSAALRSKRMDSSPTRAINLFFIQDYLVADGTLGEAGGIPGPLAMQGIQEAGVILSVDAHLRVDGTLDTDLLGSTMAHEVGHQVGLFHTTEEDGSRTETIDDTPDCPPEADVDVDGYFSAEECEAWDGPNFMFWVAGAFIQDRATTEQGQVLSRSVVSR